MTLRLLRHPLWLGSIAFLALIVILIQVDLLVEDQRIKPALVVALKRQGFRVIDAKNIQCFKQEKPTDYECLFSAYPVADYEQQYYDVFVARIKHSGRVLKLKHWQNISKTPGADERSLVKSGKAAIYTTKRSGFYEGFTRLTLPHSLPAYARSWSWLKKTQFAIGNWQDTGRFQGLGKTRYVLKEPAQHMRIIATHGKQFNIAFNHTKKLVRVSALGRVKQGNDQVVSKPHIDAQPGNITWLVDRVRQLEFVGPEPIAWLEHRVFTLKDWVQRRTESLWPSENDDAIDFAKSKSTVKLRFPSPETHLPPLSLKTVITRKPIKGEGQWLPIAPGSFVNGDANASPAFFQTFLRGDPERSFSRTHIILWDPRQVQLHFMSGSAEPESESGETDTGLIPREPFLIENLVAAFNGGFQALHGEFGVMNQGQVFLPPKPWAATLGIFANGQVGMGSWPSLGDTVKAYSPRLARQQIPEQMVAFRQNLTSLVEGKRFNPWKRWWWGAAPLHTNEQTYIDRSGLCVTEEGWVAYFWGRSMGPEALGTVMLRARCVRGMHLDMNLPHTGFEFYRTSKEQFANLGRSLRDFEYEGMLPHSARTQYHVRVRKAVKTMQPIRFPRYIRRERRDFFYLTLRPHLPGKHQNPMGQNWQTDNLPSSDWPFAFAKLNNAALTNQGTQAIRIDLHRLDLSHWTSGCAASGQELAALVQRYPRDSRGRILPSLPVGPSPSMELRAKLKHSYWRLRMHRIAEHEPHTSTAANEPQPVILMQGQGLHERPNTQRALAIDPEGFLLYLDRGDSEQAPRIAVTLAKWGIAEDQAMAIPDHVQWAWSNGEGVPVDIHSKAYELIEIDKKIANFCSRESLLSKVLFADNKPRPYRVWARIQDARVRYFRNNPPVFRRNGQINANK